MPVPNVRVEVAFASAPGDAVQVWTDISEWVRLADGITMTRGRSDEFDTVQPGRLSLTLNNTGGNFTFGYASGAYYPNVVPGRQIRVAVSPDGATWYPRWRGYVDGWPAEWDNGVTEQPRVRITATDRLARAGLQRALRDALHEELGTAAEDQSAGWVLDDAVGSVLGETTVLSGGVVWLYGLQEQVGATVFGDVSGAQGRGRLTVEQFGTGGEVEAGVAGIMPEGTAVKFTPASANNGLLLSGDTPGVYLGTEFSVWAQFAWNGATGVGITQIGKFPDPRVILAATGSTVTATIYGTTTVTVTKTIVTNDNAPHFVLLSVSGSTASLYVDEESAATGTMPAGMGTRSSGMYVGTISSADEVQVAWVGYGNAATAAGRAGELGMLGSGGSERSDLRVARILRWIGVGDSELDVGLSDVAYQASGGRSALELFAEIDAVEAGTTYVDGEGRVRFQSRDYRYNQDSFILLASDVSGDLAVAVDVGRVVNDVTVSRPRGATYRYRDEASVAAYEERSESLTLYTGTDDELVTAAQWRVARLREPMARIPAVSCSLLTLSEGRARAVLWLDVGDELWLTGLPSATTPGGASVSLLVEGVEEVVGLREWGVTLATSPAWGKVWQLDDTTRSVLGDTTVVAY